MTGYLSFYIMAKAMLKVPCKPDGINDPLLKWGQTVSVAASGTTTITQFTIPTGRGDVQAIDIIAGNSTIADLDQLFLTLLANGNQILFNDCLLEYSSLFQNNRRPMRIIIPEAAIISGSVVNGSANIVPLFINYYFYNPYNQ